MSALIDEDILSIGTSKWNQQFHSLHASIPGDDYAPANFMLPAVANVKFI